jgi:phenylacetate-CoA ligase
MSIFKRHILEPIYCRLSRSPKLRYWKELEKSQFYPEERLREFQWQQLKKMLYFSFENNVFYHNRFNNAGVLPNDIRSPSDLSRLPILSKAEIRSNTRSMISRSYNIEKLQKAKTGGSTGKALKFFFTEECSSLRNACTLRHDLWSGWKRGEPVAAIWGNPVFPTSFKEKIRQYFALPAMIYLDTMAVSSSSVLKFIEQWRRVKPTLIFGHAHSIFILSMFLEKLEIRDLRPSAVISSSMMLIPHEREKIEEVFGVRVTDRYGCEEVGLIASECERHEGMHLNIEHLFIEFIRDDGTAAAPGETGKIVVTDLRNRAMPLIRYQVEDIGVPTDRQCSCGRGLPLMDGIIGRVADFMIKKDGTRVAGVSLIENTLTHFPGLDQMQIVQNGFDEFLVRIVPGTDYNDRVIQELEKYFRQIFGNTIKVEFDLVDAIKAEKSGKYRFSICQIV